MPLRLVHLADPPVTVTPFVDDVRHSDESQEASLLFDLRCASRERIIQRVTYPYSSGMCRSCFERQMRRLDAQKHDDHEWQPRLDRLYFMSNS